MKVLIAFALAVLVATPGYAQGPKRDPNEILARKIECMKVGTRVEKDRFPDGLNSVESINAGLMNFAFQYAYSEALNTCVVLTGSQTVNFKTHVCVAFQATIEDMLSNKMLFTYLVFNGHSLAPASIERTPFLAKVRELFGEPVPKWLEIGCVPPT